MMILDVGAAAEESEESEEASTPESAFQGRF